MISEKCQKCRFLDRNSSSGLGCAPIRRQMGANTGRCRYENYRYFEPVLKPNMKVTMRNWNEFKDYNKISFMQIEGSNLSPSSIFEIVSDLKSKAFIVLRCKKNGYFHKAPKRLLVPVQEKIPIETNMPDLIEKCKKCRFLDTDHSFKYNFPRCARARRNAGAGSGNCMTRGHRYFEPILESGMRVKVRNFDAMKTINSANFYEIKNIDENLILVRKEIFHGEKWLCHIKDTGCAIHVPERLLVPDIVETPMPIETIIKCLRDQNSCLFQVIRNQFDPSFVVTHRHHVDKNLFNNKIRNLRCVTGVNKNPPKISGQHHGMLIFDDIVHIAPKPQISKYEFRGDLDIEMIVNSAIEDNKRSFIVMGKEDKCVCGLLRDSKMSLLDLCEVNIIFDIDSPYDIFEIKKEKGNAMIKILKQEKIDFDKAIKKKKRKIHKQTTKRIKNNIKAERFQVFTF